MECECSFLRSFHQSRCLCIKCDQIQIRGGQLIFSRACTSRLPNLTLNTSCVGLIKYLCVPFTRTVRVSIHALADIPSRAQLRTQLINHLASDKIACKTFSEMQVAKPVHFRSQRIYIIQRSYPEIYQHNGNLFQPTGKIFKRGFLGDW